MVQEKPTISVNVKLSDGSQVVKDVEKTSKEMTLHSLLEEIVGDSVDKDWDRLDWKRPLPRRMITKNSEELKMYSS